MKRQTVIQELKSLRRERRATEDCNEEDSISDAVGRSGLMPSSSKFHGEGVTAAWEQHSGERYLAQFSAQWGKECERKLTTQAWV